MVAATQLLPLPYHYYNLPLATRCFTIAGAAAAAAAADSRATGHFPRKKSRQKSFDYLAGCFHPEICRLMWEIFDRVSLAYRILFSKGGTLGVREQKGLPSNSSQYV